MVLHQLIGLQLVDLLQRSGGRADFRPIMFHTGSKRVLLPSLAALDFAALGDQLVNRGVVARGLLGQHGALREDLLVEDVRGV